MKRPQREFYSIGEVCALFDVKPQLIALIRHLVHDERYTLEGARKRIDELRQEGAAAELASRALERSFVRSLRTELEEILELLAPAG